MIKLNIKPNEYEPFGMLVLLICLERKKQYNNWSITRVINGRRLCQHFKYNYSLHFRVADTGQLIVETAVLTVSEFLIELILVID